MKKYLLGFVVFLFLTTVFAYSFSMRGSGGAIDYIGGDINLVPNKVKFSVWESGAKGGGSLEIIGKTTEGKRVVLNVRFNKNGEGIATYYKQGGGKSKTFETTVNYNYNKKKKRATITGAGEINFKVSNVNVKKELKVSEQCTFECSVDGDCTENFCDSWFEDYCSEGDVYHSRICHGFGCLNSKCMEDIYEEIVLLECEYGCEEGKCLEPPECLIDSDCDADYYSENYCAGGNVVREQHDFSCLNEKCVENIANESVEECLHGCSEGECLIPEENHDVGLEENYDGFGHIIKINDPENNPMENDTPVVDCTSEYDVKFSTENLGDFTEDVEINLKIKDSENNIVYEDTKTKEDLVVGGTTTTGNKNNFVFNFSSGNYNIFADISIIGFDDADLTNNNAERQVEVEC